MFWVLASCLRTMRQQRMKGLPTRDQATFACQRGAPAWPAGLQEGCMCNACQRSLQLPKCAQKGQNDYVCFSQQGFGMHTVAASKIDEPSCCQQQAVGTNHPRSRCCALVCLQHPGTAPQRNRAAGRDFWHGQEHPGCPPGSAPGHHDSAVHRQHPAHAAELPQL